MATIISKTEAEKFMMLAIHEARKNLKEASGGPFGACIVKKGKVIAVSRNTVLVEDASCHAEVNAIRKASAKLKTFDLSGCVIYSTTEPCPMCLCAIHWARIDAVVFGTGIFDAKKIGFNEMPISARSMKRIGNSSLKITSGFMLKECRALFNDWMSLPDKQVY
jgi:guanine deaminase